MRKLRICLIASNRFPISEPFVGGLEAHTHNLTRLLVERGHSVSLFAGKDPNLRLNVVAFDTQSFRSSPAARQDLAAPPERWMEEHHAYLSLCLDLAREAEGRFDIIHNNSIHHLPIAMSQAISVPILTTLHTPPTPMLESAIKFAAPSSSFVAVSNFTASQWNESVCAKVILNGADVVEWSYGAGGDAAIWFGRLVPEKAPHLAIAAARISGMPLNLAGPILDEAYFAEKIAPHLDNQIRYLGHLDTKALARCVGAAAVALITPQWDEPYGLVAAESMACGTPVAAFARGGLAEVIQLAGGRLCEPNNVEALAEAMIQARSMPRADIRQHAIRHCSSENMVNAYESAYLETLTAAEAA